MANVLRKTAVIGLGGTGMKSVLNMKKKLIDTYGEIPSMIKFLVIDTTDKDHLETKEGEIELDPGEFLKIEVRSPGNLMTNAEVKEWIPNKVPKFALTSGAKQVRPLGRLAVFANAAPLEAKIDGLISSVRDYRVERSGDTSDNIVVNIICSISGGTGAGSIIDVACLARKNLESTDKLIGYLLLPDIFVGKPATDNVEPNAFGTIKEINYFFTDDGTHRYKFGGRERKIEGGLFNAVYLINNMNRNGTVYNNINDLYEFLGMGLFLQSSSAGKKATDIIDNLEAQLLGKNWFGKPTVFSSFGISELVYPGDWFADLYAKGIALSVVQKTFLGGDISRVNEFTDDFIQRVGIKEHDADDVINSILAAGDFRKFPLPPDFNKERVNQTIGKRKAHLNGIQKNVSEAAKENLAKFKKDKLKELNEELINRLSTPQGLELSKNFLYALVGRLTEFKKEMNEERNEYVKLKEEISQKFNFAKSEAERASKKIFGAKVAIGNALKKYKELVDNEATFILERERRERAIEFFAFIIDKANKWIEKLDAFSNYCSVLTQELNQDIQQKQQEKKETKPFVLELKPDNLKEEIPNMESNDFLIWLRNDKQMDMLELAEMRVGKVKEILLEYGYSQKEVQEVKNKKLDDILKELPQSERMKYIGLLDKMASPLWQYNQGFVSVDKKTENIYLFGVENPNKSVFVPEEIRTAIASPYDPAVIGTGDPKRVICFKVEAAVPAFVVSNMPRYREKYINPNKPFCYHIHKDWEKGLPSLFPSAEEDEVRIYWSLGLAEPFNLICKTGQHYYFKSEKKGKKLDDFKVKLKQGRAEAMKAFLDNSEYVDEAGDNIDKIIKDLGNNKVAEALRNYGDEIEKKATRFGKEIRNQIELELNDIEGYINSILE
ncbi:MAG: hypothetical protein CMM60_04290 [Rhodospirillaceae bacterium]|nr:hypothetical protein [Rhodospirillaceae bacterium]|tara:strand:- start:7002 stop:9680 length:2679 start_codon:yes stop_codon:yes gene_type:complete